MFHFQLKKRGMLFVFGNSGIGKTTILRTIVGLEKNKNGSIILNEKQYPSNNKI